MMTRSRLHRRLYLALALLGVLAGGCAGQVPRHPSLAPPRTLTIGGAVDDGARDAPSAVDRLVVGTYNVRQLRNAAAVREDLARLWHVQVWCLQEVRLPAAAADWATGTGDALAAMQHAMATLLPPGQWHVAVLAVNPLTGSPDTEAQVVASRLPLRSSAAWELDNGSSRRRVALVAVVDTNGGLIHIVNTDHEPSFLAWRDGNAVQVAALCERLAPVSGPVVVAGDFNAAGNLFRLRGHGRHRRQVDAALAAAGFQSAGDEVTFTSGGLLRFRLDRIYTRDLRTEAAAVEGGRGSDHAPLWCRLRLAPDRSKE